jgi:hypothetical protein
MTDIDITEPERLSWSIEPTHVRAEKRGHVFSGSVSDVLGRIGAFEEGDHPRSDQLAYARTKEAHSKINRLLVRFFAFSREHLLFMDTYEQRDGEWRRAQDELDALYEIPFDEYLAKSAYETQDTLQATTEKKFYMASDALEKATQVLKRGTGVLQELTEQPRDALRSHKGVRVLVESFDSEEAHALRSLLEAPA